VKFWKRVLAVKHSAHLLNNANGDAINFHGGFRASTIHVTETEA